MTFDAQKIRSEFPSLKNLIYDKPLVYLDSAATTLKPKVVIDEMIGVWIALLGFALTPFNLIAAFILFRFFDIAKPLGIRQLENIKGGWGVMLDDVLAGVYANVVLQLWIILDCQNF